MTKIRPDIAAVRLLRTGEAADLLGIDGRTLVNWMLHGGGPKGRIMIEGGMSQGLRFRERDPVPFLDADFRPEPFVPRPPRPRWISFRAVDWSN